MQRSVKSLFFNAVVMMFISSLLYQFSIGVKYYSLFCIVHEISPAFQTQFHVMFDWSCAIEFVVI